MGVAERRIREREILRERILTAASELIQEEGYEKLTIRKVASRIEYSPMALYNHFPDKGAILKELGEQIFRRFLAASPRLPGNSPMENLRRYMFDYIQFAIDEPDQYRIIFMTPRRGSHADVAKGQQTTDHVPEGYGRDAFARVVEDVAACGKEYTAFRDAFAVALFIWTGMHGAASLLITMNGFPFGSPKEYAESTIDLLLSGLVASSHVDTSGDDASWVGEAGAEAKPEMLVTA